MKLRKYYLDHKKMKLIFNIVLIFIFILVINESKANTLLANSKRNVWWKEEKDGWKVKAAQSGKFLYIA